MQCRCRIVIGQRGEHGQTFRAAFFATGRENVEHAAAADGVAGRGVAQDEAVTGEGADFAVDGDLRPVFHAGLDVVSAKQCDPGQHIFGPEMQVNLSPVLERRLAGQHTNPDVKTAHRRVQWRGNDPHAAFHLGLFNPVQRQGYTLPGVAGFGRAILHAQTADANRDFGR